MRILFVTDFYHPYSGGVEIHVRTVAMELAERGHEVAVATLPTAEGTPERSADGPVRVYPVRHTAQVLGAKFNHQDRAWAPPFPDPVTVRGLRQVVADFQPEVIHGHDWLSRSALVGIGAGSIPIITSLHYYTRSCAKKTLWRDGEICSGPALVKCLRCAGEHYGPARGTVVTLGLRLGAALEDRMSARAISVSAATEHGNGLFGRPGSIVIANPVPVAAPVSTAEEMPDGIPDGPFILFVGDIRPEKGVAVLADAVSLLRTERGDTTPLVVVGERMSDRITLPDHTIEVGPVSNEMVQRLWGLATVGVIPSLWPEPFGLVAVEAMNAGCPVIASAVGGLSEILGDGRAVLVEPNDHRALAREIADLLADPARRTTLSDNAKESVGRYSVKVIVDQLEQQYRSVLP